MARFDQAIPPGGEGEITLKLKTKGYQGALHKSAVVYSNDPKHPQIRLAVKAHVKVPISVHPRGVMLDGFVGDEIKQVVTIRAHEEQPLTLESAQLSLPKKVAYELKSVEEGRLYQLILRNISEKEEDKYSGSVTLKTNYPQQPEIIVVFLGYIKGNLQCTPGTINFGRIDTAQMEKQKQEESPYQRSVMVTLHQGENLKIEKIEINAAMFETQVKEIKPGKSYRIDVILQPEKLPKGIVNEKMKVYTNFKNNPVKVISIGVEKI